MSEFDDLVGKLKIAQPDGEAPRPVSALDQLLAGADAEQAVEPSDEEFGSLEDEWRLLADLKARRDKLKARLKEVQASYDAQKARMASAMEAQGTRQFASTLGRGAGSLAHEYRTKVEDEAAFMAWVNETHPELLSVNAQTRDSFIRTQYRDQGIAPDDDDFPPGLKVVEQDVLRVRNVRAASEEGTESL